MRTYLGHLIRTTWFTLTWETGLAIVVVSLAIATTYVPNRFLAATGAFLAFAGIMSIIFIPIVELTKNYWKTLYRNEGLFTHTLPISKRKIFNAHAIWVFTCCLINFCIFIITVLTWIIIKFGIPTTDEYAQIKQGLLNHKLLIFFYLAAILVNSACSTIIFLGSISVGMHSKLYGRLGIAAPVLTVLIMITLQQLIGFVGTTTSPIYTFQKSSGINIILKAESGTLYYDTYNTIISMVNGWVLIITFTAFIYYLAIRFLNKNLSVSG